MQQFCIVKKAKKVEIVDKLIDTFVHILFLQSS